jgi:hypothetical protein
LNSATESDFASIPGVDAGQAEAIVGLRARRGHLSSIEELRALPVLDDASLTRLREHTAVAIDLPVQTKKAYSNANEVLAEFAGEPTVAQVQAWANDYAQTSPHMVTRWLRQSRSFAALPQLTLEYKMKDGWDQDFDYLRTDGVEAVTPDEKTFPTIREGAVDQDRTYTVRARWDLDQLVMSSERIRVINEAQDIVKLRDKTMSEVTRLYFERRRAQVDMLLRPASDTMGQVKDQLRLMELTANIDALTGGAFSGGTNRRGPRRLRWGAA